MQDLFIAVCRIVPSGRKASCPMCISYPLWHEDLEARKASSFPTQKIVDIIFAKLVLFLLKSIDSIKALFWFIECDFFSYFSFENFTLWNLTLWACFVSRWISPYWACSIVLKRLKSFVTYVTCHPGLFLQNIFTSHIPKVKIRKNWNMSQNQ